MALVEAWTETPDLPDGRMAHGNGDLVAAAAAMLARNAPQ
jgi:hypothetical protein